MTEPRLTGLYLTARSTDMGIAVQRTGRLMMLVAGAMALTGCISVESPDKPIVIELNINIKQEVIYRLAEDAADTIEENADIF